MHSQSVQRITNALLYQLSYSGVFRISGLALLLRIIMVRCSGFCASFSPCAVQKPAQPELYMRLRFRRYRLTSAA